MLHRFRNAQSRWLALAAAVLLAGFSRLPPKRHPNKLIYNPFSPASVGWGGEWQSSSAARHREAK